MRADMTSREQLERVLLAPADSQEICVGESIEALGQVRQPAVSLALWRRWPDASLADWLATTLPERGVYDAYFPGDAVDVPAFASQIVSRSHPEPGRSQLLSSESAQRFIADVQQLVAIFCSLRPESRQHSVHLKLAVVDKADCPVLHVDWIALRLICTYFGVGTEYADSRSVQRSALCHPLGSAAETNAAILRDPQGLRRMRPFEVGLFKGSAYPGQDGRGIVHRSPPKSCGRRIKLIIDSTLPPEQQDIS